MRIGIDARVFIDKQYTGISRSVAEILKVWARDFPDNDYFLFSRSPIFLDFDLPDNWHIIDTPWIIDKGKLWAMFKLPKLIRNLELDYYWGSNYTLPHIVNSTKYIVTIYDLALFKFRNIGERINLIRIKIFAKQACKKAVKIVAISNATKQDIEHIFNIPSNKITVSYCGGLPSNYTKPQYSIANINPECIIKNPFLLFISTIEPRKNIITIIHAFEKFLDKTNSDMKLVLAGRRGWKCDSIYDAVEQSKYRNSIIMPGFISDLDKSYLLSNAKAFVYPSLYEGFGIPILEAMTYNLPVITTDVSSMPEVGGDAAFYINNPYDTDELEKAMEKVVNLTPQELEKYNERMEVQVAKFSWVKNAHEMMELMVNEGLNKIK